MSSAPTPSKADSIALWITILLGAAAVVWTVVHAILRIIEIASNQDVSVRAAFADTPATMPIGVGGESVEIVAQEVIVRVSDMPAVTLWSLILAEAAYAIAVVATITLVSLIIRNIIRGRAFSSRTVRLVGTATLTVGVGFVLTWLFTTMGANGASSALTGGGSINTAFPMDPIVLFAIVSMGALTAAFQVGHRLQRDTEGLV